MSSMTTAPPIESSNPSDFGTTWSAVSAKKTELVNAEPMRLLREERIDAWLKQIGWLIQM